LDCQTVIWNCAIVFLKNEAYFIGGYDANNKMRKTVSIFDPFTNITRSGPSMNIARAYHSTTVINNTDIIVCGGDEKYVPCEQFSSNTQTWSMIPSFTSGFSYEYFAMATLNNRAYVFGGLQNRALSSVYMFNGTNWMSRASMPSDKNSHGAVALDNDRALVCGGHIVGQNNNVGYKALASCFIYTASTDTWTSTANMSSARLLTTMTMFNGRLHIILIFQAVF
jgi:N-acetylneuraminic acid mutarotase